MGGVNDLDSVLELAGETDLLSEYEQVGGDGEFVINPETGEEEYKPADDIEEEAIETINEIFKVAKRIIKAINDKQKKLIRCAENKDTEKSYKFKLYDDEKENFIEYEYKYNDDKGVCEDVNNKPLSGGSEGWDAGFGTLSEAMLNFLKDARSLTRKALTNNSKKQMKDESVNLIGHIREGEEEIAELKARIDMLENKETKSELIQKKVDDIVKEWKRAMTLRDNTESKWDKVFGKNYETYNSVINESKSVISSLSEFNKDVEERDRIMKEHETEQEERKGAMSDEEERQQ